MLTVCGRRRSGSIGSFIKSVIFFITICPEYSDENTILVSRIVCMFFFAEFCILNTNPNFHKEAMTQQGNIQY